MYNLNTSKCFLIMLLPWVFWFRLDNFLYVFDAGCCKGHLFISISGKVPSIWSKYNFHEVAYIHICNSTNIIWKNIFFSMFFLEYIRFVYIMLCVNLLQSIDRGSHPDVDQKTAALGQQVYLIVIVQFKYVKMFSYYVVSVSISSYFFYKLRK